MKESVIYFDDKGIMHEVQRKKENHITSIEVAEIVGREHKDVLRSIRIIVEHLVGQRKDTQSYFTSSIYLNAQNKEQPCYLLSKKGCELFASRMTGKKGTLFAAAYIDKFNDMEQCVRQQEVIKEPLELALEAALANYQEIKAIKNDIKELQRVTLNDKHHETPVVELKPYSKVMAKCDLKSLIIKAGYSLSSFSKKIPMSRQALYCVCNKQNGIRPERAKVISDLLELEFDELFEIVELRLSE